MFGPLNVFRSLPEASSTHSATAQQSPQGSSMKGLCAVVGIGTTAVLHSVLNRLVIVRGPKTILGLNLALASIQCFIVDSIAPESPDSKSARCKAVTLGEIELFTF